MLPEKYDIKEWLSKSRFYHDEKKEGKRKTSYMVTIDDIKVVHLEIGMILDAKQLEECGDGHF